MDSNPGISLFQNSEFNKRQFNSPEPEELEAAEDEKRRNEEISEMMKGAFDDLEDSRSITNSHLNSPLDCERNYKQISRPNSLGSPKKLSNYTPNYRSPGYDDYQKLEVRYQVRLREVENLNNEIENYKEISNKEKTQLLDKIHVLKTEKENAVSSYNESQKCLAETNRRLSEREKEFFELQKHFIESENTKNKALHELEMCKMNNREMEQRLIIAEKTSFKIEEKNFDNHLKEITSKHKREINDLQKEINTISNKLSSKEKENKELEHLLMDLRTIHESVILEKSEIINKLTANLEESQSQCHKLLSNSVTSDNTRFITHLKKQKAEIDSLNIQLTALKKEKNHLLNLLENQKKEKNSSKEVQTLSSEEILKMENKIRDLIQENENLKKKTEEVESSAKKDNFFKFIEENVTTEMKERISKLEAELEENLKECDQVKKMYIDVCTVKDKLMKDNATFEKELNDMKNEKNQQNELIKNLSNDKEELNQKVKLLKEELSKQEKEPENIKTKHEEQIRKINENHSHELDSLKLALQHEFSRMEIFHQDQMSKLELECSKKILELESNYKIQLMQVESSIKEEAMRVCTEEIESLSNTYKKQIEQLLSVNSNLEKELKEKTSSYEILRKQFDEVKSFHNRDYENGEVKRLRNQLDDIEIKYNKAIVEWNEKLEQTTEKYNNLRVDFQEIYNKYKKTRKVATTLKEMLEERNRYVRDRHEQYIQIMKEIQNYLDEILKFKSVESGDAEDELVPSKEFDFIMNSINKKLQILRNKTVEQR